MREISLRQLKHDGHCYRRYQCQVISRQAEGFVLFAPRGTVVWGVEKSWTARYDLFKYLWFGRWYNLSELFDADGQAVEVYADIASPVDFTNGVVHYTDYELDVTSIDGPRLVDEDEFAEAVEKYGYSAELQARCYTAAEEALALVTHWQPGLPP